MLLSTSYHQRIAVTFYSSSALLIHVVIFKWFLYINILIIIITKIQSLELKVKEKSFVPLLSPSKYCHSLPSPQELRCYKFHFWGTWKKIKAISLNYNILKPFLIKMSFPLCFLLQFCMRMIQYQQCLIIYYLRSFIISTLCILLSFSK